MTNKLREQIEEIISMCWHKSDEIITGGYIFERDLFKQEITNLFTAYADEVLIDFAKWWSRKQTEGKEDYIVRMSLSEAIKQAKTYKQTLRKEDK